MVPMGQSQLPGFRGKILGEGSSFNSVDYHVVCPLRVVA